MIQEVDFYRKTNSEGLRSPLDERLYRRGTKDLNRTNLRLRLLVLIAIATGMRASEIFGLRWSDIMYSEGLIAVRSKLKGGKMRYVLMAQEMAVEIRRYPAIIGEDRIFASRVRSTKRAAESGGKFR